MKIHFNLTSMKVCLFQLPFIKIWRLMEILAIHYNGVSKQHRRLNISETEGKIFWSLLKFDMMQIKAK